MTQFSVDRLDVDVANQFIHNARHASVFTKPQVLNQLTSAKLEYWGCRKGNELVAVWPACVNASGHMFCPDFSYYVGPVMCNAYHDSPAHRKSTYLISVFHSFISAFHHHYDEIAFNLNPHIDDVRFFTWSNDSSDSGYRFQVNARYTARIDDLLQKSESDLVQNFRERRRNHYRQVVRDGKFIVKTSAEMTSELDILAMYTQTLSVQGADADFATLNALRNLVNGPSVDSKRFLIIKSVETGEVAFFSLILIDTISANLVCNLTNQKFRNSKVSTLGIMSSILEAKKMGCQTFDFNGANSPNRADDKHSYGATPKLFFSIKGKRV
jgi:hypothetical protein